MRFISFVSAAKLATYILAAASPDPSSFALARADAKAPSSLTNANGTFDPSHKPHVNILGIGTLFAVNVWKSSLISQNLKPYAQMGLFVKNVWNAYSVCNDAKEKWQNSVECLFASADALAAACVAVYAAVSNPATRARRDIPLTDGRPNYGNATIKHVRSDGIDLHLWSVAHIPHDGSLAWASMDSASASLSANHTWEHHASYYIDDRKVYHLYHRLAHPEDLGSENPGSIHQYRVQPSELDHPSAESNTAVARRQSESVTKRDSRQAGAIKTDYIWESNSSKDRWAYWNGGANALGDTWAEKFEANGWQAGCASPGFCSSLYGTTTCTDTWNGVLAYGMNEQDFNFQGHGKGWMDQCGGSCTSGDSRCTLQS